MKVRYVADDGMIFDDEEKCLEYEQYLADNAEKFFLKLPVQTNSTPCNFYPFCLFTSGGKVYAVKIEGKLPLGIVNRWIESHKPHNICDDLLNEKAIGTVQLIWETPDKEIEMLGTPDDLKKVYCDGVDTLFRTLPTYDF